MEAIGQVGERVVFDPQLHQVIEGAVAVGGIFTGCVIRAIDRVLGC
jgi:hypothetical protein